MTAAVGVNSPTVKEVKSPEKKPKAPKGKKSKQTKTASHPPYFQMIKDALLALKEKGGSSPYAIAKYMEQKHKSVLPANFKKMLGLQLKNQAARGKLVKIKASYKLSEAAKKEKKAVVTAKKANTEKQQQRAMGNNSTVTVSVPKSKKRETIKKVVKKKTNKVTGPAKPKQPKSIKSPSKRTRKTAA